MVLAEMAWWCSLQWLIAATCRFAYPFHMRRELLIDQWHSDRRSPFPGALTASKIVLLSVVAGARASRHSEEAGLYLCGACSWLTTSAHLGPYRPTSSSHCTRLVGVLPLPPPPSHQTCQVLQASSLDRAAKLKLLHRMLAWRARCG